MENKKWQDKDMQLIIGNLLRGGVTLSVLVVLSGGIVYLVRHGREMPDFKTFKSEPPHLRTITGILGGVIEGKGKSIIQLGILILIATPIVRVAFSIIGYLLEKDYLYVGITFLVLVIILFSLIGGLGA